MPSQSLDTGWDFSPVIDLIESASEDICSPALRPTTQSSFTPACEDGGVRLGSFSKLFESLGFSDSLVAPLPPLDPDSELSNSDDALLPSPTLKPAQAPVECVENSTVEPISSPGLTKTQRKKARRRAEKELLEEQTRQRIMQETLDQLAEEREQREHQKQQGSNGKQSDKLTNNSVEDNDVAEKPQKPSRTSSRSNVGAKIRPTTAPESTGAHDIQLKQPKQPKTPKLRPSILKQSYAVQPVTPQPLQKAPVITPCKTPVPNLAIHETSSTPVLDQHIDLPPQRPSLRPSLVATPVRHGLVPRTVRPVTLPRSASQPAVVAQAPTTPTPRAGSFSGRRPPLVIRSKTDRHLHLFNKLMEKFPEDQKWLVAPMQLLNEKQSEHGLHVFVDASNIMIGLKDMLRLHGLHHNAYDISFDSLALLMERRRPVAKRFFAGSHREANPLPHIEKLVETSKAVGYDSVMQEQVLIVREDSEKKKFFNDVKKMGWHKATQMRSGSGSDSETSAPAPKTPAAPKWVEQGVDEILHLKMCQSIIDCEWPSTMVLATGDGAVAEMSDGFLAHVERALKRGWRVELISWGQQINSGYRKRQFRAKWGEQFTIIELDEFLEDLIDTR
ncbi:hypothetical protein COCCADRAFT_84128 [Bipolaris zeicola 26-R-13]|uniref:NYN domain-containing protein n=1 Tax=Cochliobolus carbonum (strain 26-R-13) TaxID=930089 RepID=W6Z2S5_COCC2|nr:uncharacterized protein COCCADRAFT_84128 [Bipolaris zeicola 26-R-13]EUC37981.1 hypothetical protein COCCADRAFT_84128 [Bipolaris zeicola 26-R-13]